MDDDAFNAATVRTTFNAPTGRTDLPKWASTYIDGKTTPLGGGRFVMTTKDAPSYQPPRPAKTYEVHDVGRVAIPSEITPTDGSGFTCGGKRFVYRASDGKFHAVE